MRGWVCRLQLLLVLASAVILESESRRTQDHILVSQIRDSSNLKGRFPVFIFPRNRVALLYPKALGSLFVALYDSQGYGGGIRPRLHTGVCIRQTVVFSIHCDMRAQSQNCGTSTDCLDLGTDLLSHAISGYQGDRGKATIEELWEEVFSVRAVSNRPLGSAVRES
jgi:hypothetical protein